MIDVLKELRAACAVAVGKREETVTLSTRTAVALELAISNTLRLAGNVETYAAELDREIRAMRGAMRPILPDIDTTWSKDAPVSLAPHIALLDQGQLGWQEIEAGMRQQIADYMLRILAERHETIEEAYAAGPHWLPSWTSMYRYYNARWNHLKARSR